MNDALLLAQLIQQAHNWLQDEDRLNNTHLILGNIQQNPVRIVIQGNPILRQYHINNNSVRMDYFFNADLAGIYDEFLDRFPNNAAPQNNNPHQHDFGFGIRGNGLDGGITRSIFTTINQGANHYNDNGFGIAIDCVNKMMQLIYHIEPQLPVEYRINPINYPNNFFF